MGYWGSRYPRSKVVVAGCTSGYPRDWLVAAEQGLANPSHPAAVVMMRSSHPAAVEQGFANPSHPAAVVVMRSSHPVVVEQKTVRSSHPAAVVVMRPSHPVVAVVPMHYRQHPPCPLDSSHPASLAVALEAASLAQRRTYRHLRLSFCPDCGRAEWP